MVGGGEEAEAAGEAGGALMGMGRGGRGLREERRGVAEEEEEEEERVGGRVGSRGEGDEEGLKGLERPKVGI